MFRNAHPVLVISWRTIDEKRVPFICFDLDPALLQPIDLEHRSYRYHGQLIRPATKRRHG